MNFQFQTIDNSRFRKYKITRYSLYYILILLIFLIVGARKKDRASSESNNIAQLIGIDSRFIFIAIIVIGLIACLLYFYSKSFKKMGRIEIDCQKIMIEQNGVRQIYEMTSIEDLKIERGSTWHYWYRKDNYLIQTDNWIKFISNKIYLEIEFSLLTAEENSQFESMLIYLTDKRINFQFFSI